MNCCVLWHIASSLFFKKKSNRPCPWIRGRTNEMEGKCVGMTKVDLVTRGSREDWKRLRGK
jgi:hypothetical protein